MSISFGRKNKGPGSKIPNKEIKEALSLHLDPPPPERHSRAKIVSRLVDLRHPDVFKAGFIPGSYNVPDLACVRAARRTRFFEDRQVYLLADDVDQLQLCSESGDLGAGAKIMGWFGPDALEEWQKFNPEIGFMETITSDVLSVRMAAWDTLVIDICEYGNDRRLTHPNALRFDLGDLPLGLEGLPSESSICLTATTCGLASYAASLLWNFGLHGVSYLSSGCRVQFPMAS